MAGQTPTKESLLKPQPSKPVETVPEVKPVDKPIAKPTDKSPYISEEAFKMAKNNLLSGKMVDKVRVPLTSKDFVVKQGVILSEEQEKVLDEVKAAFDKLPESVRRVTRGVTVEDADNRVLGHTDSTGGYVTINAKYFHDDKNSQEIDVLMHEIGHTIDGATFWKDASGVERSLSRDPAVQPLLKKVYPRMVNYEGWASLFGTYMQLEIGLAKEKTPYDAEILTYFRQLLPFDQLNRHVELPKIDVLNSEQPKVEQPKSEQPKVEQPKVEQPKVEQPKVKQPKVEQPKVEQPKVEQPKVEQPKVEQPKVEQPKVEQSKVEQSKSEQPKVEQSENNQLTKEQELTKAAREVAIAVGLLKDGLAFNEEQVRYAEQIRQDARESYVRLQKEETSVVSKQIEREQVQAQLEAIDRQMDALLVSLSNNGVDNATVDSATVDSAMKSVDSVTKPVDSVTKSVDNVIVDNVTKSVDSVTKPVDKVTQPVDSVTKFVDSATKSVDSVTQPVDSVTKFIDGVTKPVDMVTQPVDSATRSVDSVTKPVDKVIQPVDKITQPVDEVTRPVDKVTENSDIDDNATKPTVDNRALPTTGDSLGLRLASLPFVAAGLLFGRRKKDY